MSPTAPKAAPNMPTLGDYKAELRKLGEQAGKGKDTYSLALVKIVEAAHLGVIDLTKDKFGTGIDDQTQMAEEYVKAANAHTVFSAKSDSHRKLRSNFGKCIKFGSATKYGPGEPIGVLDRLLSLRRKLLGQAGNAKRMEDTANSMLRFMTAQLKRDAVIADSELSTYIYKSMAPDKAVGKALAEIVKGMTKLTKGKYARCPEAYISDELTQAIALINQNRNALLAPAPGTTTP